MNPFREVGYAIVEKDGVAPKGFFATSNRKTQIFYKCEWRAVKSQRMDATIIVGNEPECRILRDLKKGEKVAIGNDGIREEANQVKENEEFSFMSSSFSSERNNSVAIAGVLEQIKSAKYGGQKVLLVCGPVVVHSGGREHLASLIRKGWVDVIFAGNALATHDIEAALFGTSLGIDLKNGKAIEGGHRHHLYAINEIRRIGGIKKAVESGLLKEGVMYECEKKKVKCVLAGSIRDDGPLLEVITDAIDAQKKMMENLGGVGIAIVIGSMLHGIATGNMLKDQVKFICIDTNQGALNKLIDRGSVQAMGIVCAADDFLRSLDCGLLGLSE